MASTSEPQAIPRADARVKVTGLARYPSDVPVGNAAFAQLLTSAVALGSIRSIDLDEARAVPGVLDILTWRNANVVRPLGIFSKGGQAGSSIVPLNSAKIWHDGQIVAMVVAETFEAASEAARKIAVEYDEQPPTATFGSPGTTVKPVAEVDDKHKDPMLGDAESAFSGAPVTIDAEYGTPTQHHNPMELFTTTCVWDNNKLTGARAEPVRLRHEIWPCRAAWDRSGGRARDQPVRRRRVRIQGIADSTDGADCDRRAASRPPGQTGRHPQAGFYDRDLPGRDPASLCASARAGTARSSPTCTRRGSSPPGPTTTTFRGRRAPPSCTTTARSQPRSMS